MEDRSKRGKFVLNRRNALQFMGAAGAFLPSLLTSLSASAQQAALKRGGVLIAAISMDPPHLMSGVGSEISNMLVSGQQFDTLVDVAPDFTVRSSLARSWSVSDDGLRYTFNLRDGIVWHDGSPLTSEDVKFSIAEINSKYNSFARNSYKGVKEIETPDPLTVIIHFETPDPAAFPWAFAQPNFAQVFPKHIFEGSDPRSNPAIFAPIGTGPFKFREWVRGSHITLERNPDYFLADDLYLDRIVIRIIPDSGTRQLALERGEVDYIPTTELSPSSVAELAANPEVEIITTNRSTLSLIHMWINTRSGPLAKKEVRHAIAHGFDRQRIVDLALGGRARPGTGPIRSDTPHFYNPNIRRYEYDPDRSNGLLDEAGFPRGSNGERFRLRLLYSASGEGGTLQSAAEIMREQLAGVGIALQLMPSDSQTYSGLSHQWDFDLTMGSFATGPDPKFGIHRFYTTDNLIKGQWANVSGYSNPLVDKMLAQANTEMNQEVRWDLYHQAQVQIVEDLPAIWMWEHLFPIAVRKGLVGLPSGALHDEGFKNVGWVS